MDPQSGPEANRQVEREARQRAGSGDPAADTRSAAEREADRVLHAFFRDGRLVSIPARQGKRLFVLRELRQRCFPEDRDYPEKEVDMRLALVHPDVAALRRYLVDARLMSRSDGTYRRVPGEGV